MTIAQSNLPSPVPSPPMTYEDYMAEGEVYGRYDIVDGVRIVAGATEEHQDIVLNLGEHFRTFQRRTRSGKVIVAPKDVLIQRTPLRVRQPDVMFISNARHALNPVRSSHEPLATAPELVVEVLSDSDRLRVINAKLADYQRVHVEEAWIVRPVERTLEVLRLTPEALTSLGVYGGGETVQSLTFPDLRVAVDAIFTE